MTSAPRLLILYATTDGHTGRVAAFLGDAVRAHGALAEVVEAARAPRGLELAAFDGALVAASLHASGFQRAARRWVAAHAEELNGMPTAFLPVCLGMLEHRPETDADLARIEAAFLARTRWRPAVIHRVAGALPFTRYPFWKRVVMRRIARKAVGAIDPSRDHVYTDWDDLRAFGRSFLLRMAEAQAQPAPAGIAR